jgi:D-arabinose 1-dehydrogenase-like Zn-dependent alcohol dehydrogenase
MIFSSDGLGSQREAKMAKMRAVEVRRLGGPLGLVEREIPELGPGKIRIKVEACGICHSDSYTRDGLVPGIEYPRVPGHEVIGIVDAVGANAARQTVGRRVGVGWHGGNCGYRDTCRRGDAFACETETVITGVTSDGCADHMFAPAEALARIPDQLSAVKTAAPGSASC